MRSKVISYVICLYIIQTCPLLYARRIRLEWINLLKSLLTRRSISSYLLKTFVTPLKGSMRFSKHSSKIYEFLQPKHIWKISTFVAQTTPTTCRMSSGKGTKKGAMKKARSGMAFEISLDKVTSSKTSNRTSKMTGSMTERHRGSVCAGKNNGSITKRDIDKKIKEAEDLKQARVKETLERLKKHVRWME